MTDTPDAVGYAIAHDYALGDNSRIVDKAAGPQHRVTVTLTEDSIRIGCARISIEAAQFILRKHKEAFAEKRKVEI